MGWIRRFIVFHLKRYPENLGAAEIGQFLGHRHLKTTMIYTHMLNSGAGVQSPADRFKDH